MLLTLLMITGLPAQGLGAPYPNGYVEVAPSTNRCLDCYTVTSPDALAKVAAFYLAEAAREQLPLRKDTAGKLPDYRMLFFVQQPRFLDVVLARRGSQTVARVSYHLRVPPGCA